MLPEWQAHIDELLERYREERDRLRDLQAAMGEASATVTTEDQMIKISVGPGGRLTGLEFNPRVYRRLSPSQLAAAVLVAAGEAAEQVDGQVRAALTPAPAPPDGAGGGSKASKAANASNATTGSNATAGSQASNVSAAATGSTAAAGGAGPGGTDAAGGGASGAGGATGTGGGTGGASNGQGRPGPDTGLDLARILPERPDDLDAFRERYGLRAGPGDS